MAKTYTAQEMREEAKLFELSGGSFTIPAMLRQAADLLERDEKREIAAVSAELDEWQKQALEENAALDVARDELAAKDEEIASVMDTVKKLMDNGDLLCLQKIKMEREIEKHKSLIKELADKLADILACDGVYRDGADCYKKCPEESREMCGRGKTCQLVANAREILEVAK